MKSIDQARLAIIADKVLQAALKAADPDNWSNAPKGKRKAADASVMHHINDVKLANATLSLYEKVEAIRAAASAGQPPQPGEDDKATGKEMKALERSITGKLLSLKRAAGQ